MKRCVLWKSCISDKSLLIFHQYTFFGFEYFRSSSSFFLLESHCCFAKTTKYFESVKWISIFSCFAFRLESFRHASFRKDSHLNWLFSENFTKTVPLNLTPSKAKNKEFFFLLFEESSSIENLKVEIRKIDYNSCIGIIVALAYLTIGQRDTNSSATTCHWENLE